MKRALVGILLVGTGAMASDSFLQGSLYSNVYGPLEGKPEESSLRQALLGARIEADPVLDSHWSSDFLVSADYLHPSPTDESKTNFVLREGYVQYKNGGWTLRAGMQVIPWGKSDAINPTDFLSAKDFTVFYPDEEWKRLGAPDVSVTWIPGGGVSPFRLSLVGSALFPESRPLIDSSILPSFVQIADAPSRGLDFDNFEAALKASYSGDGWDIDLIGFGGRDHAPEYGEISETLGGPSGINLTVEPFFRRIVGVGTDASFNIPGLDAWTFRFESAASIPCDVAPSDYLQDATHLDTVVGVDHPIGDDVRLQLQGVWHYYPAYRPQTDGDPLLLEIRQANSLFHAETSQNRAGGTIRLSYDPADHVGILSGLTGEVFAAAYAVSGGDFLVSPRVHYAWMDHLTTSVGMDYFGGARTNPLGALNEFSSVFAEIKYSF